MKFILYILVIFLLVLSLPIYAQDASINASVDKRVISSNEELTLTIELKVSSGNPPEPKMPELTDFQVTGRYTSSSQSMVFSNGTLERTISKTYTLTLLPNKTGKLNIPRIQMIFNGQTYQTDPIQIEVGTGQAPPPPRSRGGMPQEPDSSFDQGNKQDVFLDGKADKDEVYVGEQFLFTLGLYRASNLPSLQGQFSQLPKFEGFRKTDLDPVDRRVNYGGRVYDVREWQFSLIPVTSGQYKIDQAVLPCQADDFAMSFFSRGRPKRFQLTSDPLTINVLPLPDAGKPADFSGAVGTYTITSVVDKNNVKENEAITLKIELAGRGDLSSAKDPVIKELPEFSMYQSKSETKSNIVDNTLHTQKTYDYVLVPETSGNYTLEPIKFSFFDTALKQYKTITTDKINFTISPGKKTDKGNDSLVVSSAPEGKDVKLLKKDIGFIKPDMQVLKDYKISIFDPSVLSINLLPVLLLVGGIIFKKKSTRLKTDIGYARSLRAEKFARKRLKESEKFIDKDGENNFPTLITNAITEFIADKLNISAKGLTINDIEVKLEELELSREMILKIIDSLNECDLLKFSPATSSKVQREKIYNDVKEIMITLEKHFSELSRNNKKR
jgi:hypothetical protein